MPLISDYDKDDDQGGAAAGDGDGGSGGGGGAGGGSGGTVFAQRQRQPESSGYVPWSRVASANEDVSKREAGKLSGQVTGDVARAKGDLASAKGAFDSGFSQNYAPASPPNAAAGPSDDAHLAGLPSTGDTAAGGLPATNELTTGSAADPAATAWASFGADDRQKAAPLPDQLGGAGMPVVPPKPPPDLGAPIGDAPKGPKDLEAAAGSAWSGLLGDTLRATQEANALGSQSGVQGLLEQNYGGVPNATMDAALIGGAGRQQFGDIAKESGGNQLMRNVAEAEKSSQDRWAKLRGDIDARNAAQQPRGVGDATVDDGASRGPAGPKDETRDETIARQKQLEAYRTAGVTGYQNYTSGKYGNVNTLGDQQQFLDALTNGTDYGDGVKWGDSPTVRENVATATAALGIPQDEFIGDVKKMNPTEYTDFWLLGVIPRWMHLGEGAQTFGYGTLGGWKSPFLQAVTGFNQSGIATEGYKAAEKGQNSGPKERLHPRS